MYVQPDRLTKWGVKSVVQETLKAQVYSVNKIAWKCVGGLTDLCGLPKIRLNLPVS